MKLKEALILVFLVAKGLTSLSAAGCPSDWKDTPYGCFLTTSVHRSYVGAKNFCLDKCGNIITALLRNASLDRQNFFRNVLSVENTDIFIGLRNTSDGWYWEDGVKANPSLSVKLSNDSSRPCAQIGAYSTFEIKPVSCASFLKFICELKIHASSTVVSFKSPVSTSLPTTSVSTNVHAVSSTPSLPSTTISSNYADDYTTASPSVYTRKSLQEMTPTSSIHFLSLQFVTLTAAATSSGKLLVSSSEVPSSFFLATTSNNHFSLLSFVTSTVVATSPEGQLVSPSKVSNTLSQETSPTLVIHSTPSISVSLMSSNYTLNEKVTKYLQQISDLDSTLATSAKFASELTTNLLKSFATSNKHSSKPMIAIDTFEHFLSEYGQQHLNYSNREIHWETASMAVQIMRVYEPFDGIQLHSPNNDVSIYFQQENFINGTIVVQVLYNDLHHVLPSLFKGNAKKLEIGSKITSILRGLPSNQTAFKTNVTISFMNLKGACAKGTPDCSRKCVFWLFSPRNSGENDGKWSDEGCTLLHLSDDETVCSCNHLTSFAVLMQTTGKNKISSFDQDILSLLTIMGLSLSLFGSTVTFIAYITLTDRKSNMSQIRLNLVASLGMAHFLFVTGIRATHFPAICVMVGALLQLFFLASLCWMLVEGFQLYFRIVRVYNSEMTIKACYLFAWGFPAILVCVSLCISSFGPKGVYGFVQEDICWVSHYLYLAWVFNVPMSLILLANLIFFLRVMNEISKMEIRQPKPQRLSVVRRNLKACCLLFPLLGITWFTGCVIMFHPDVILIYIFTILNSTQGFFIFLFHCVGNREIRSAFKKKIYPNDVSRMEKRNEPIPLAIASVSNVFCDGIHPLDVTYPRDEDEALPAGHKPNYRA